MSGVADGLWEELEKRWDELEPQSHKAEREQFIIEVGSKSVAECVARELENFGSDLQHRDEE